MKGTENQIANKEGNQMTMKQLVNSMMDEAYMAGAAADAGNMTKAAY